MVDSPEGQLQGGYWEVVMRSRISLALRAAAVVPLVLLGCATIVTAAAAATPLSSYGEGAGFCASAAPGARNLTANFDNVYACGVGNGPGSSFVPSSGAYLGFFEDARYGFQCTELADRFLFDVYHLTPIKGESLTGANFVQTALAKYPSLMSGTNGTGNEPILAGDIVSFSGGYQGDGHVAIITRSTYAAGDSGNYSVTIMEENASPTGTTTANVSNWLMGSPADSRETPSSFMSLPAPTAQSAADHVLVVSATGTSYFVDASGVPHWIPDVLTFDCDAAQYPVWRGVTQSEVEALGNGQPWATRCSRPQDAANHILVVSATNTSYWVDGSGVPHWIPTAAIFDCIQNEGVTVLRNLVQSQVDSLGNGQPWATCASATPSDPTSPPPTSSPAPVASTWPEVSDPDGPTHPWTDYLNAGGTEGPTIPDGTTVLIACRVQGLSAGGTTWWYRIASSPWNSVYYASASAFYNTGTNTSGPFDNGIDVDTSVATC
jgi:hypothetical protein